MSHITKTKIRTNQITPTTALASDQIQSLPAKLEPKLTQDPSQTAQKNEIGYTTEGKLWTIQHLKTDIMHVLT